MQAYRFTFIIYIFLVSILFCQNEDKRPGSSQFSPPPLILDIIDDSRHTLSIGIAIYPDDVETLDALVKMADVAMYRVKKKGRNSFQRFSP